MKSLFLTAGALALGLMASFGAAAAGGGHVPFSYSPDPSNTPSLQRGARNFTAYCAACHSMNLLRYSRMAADLDIPEEMLQANLMFNTESTGDTMRAASSADAANWFGQKPPDLSLTARSRTPSWVYSYLMSFYVDESRPLGVNNTVLEGASMPHVLWELQGWQIKPEAKEGDDAAHEDDHGAGHGGGSPNGLELATEGQLTPKEYQAFVGDLVNFMAYAAEPGRIGRQQLGVKVMLFLFLFTFLAYLLKKEYWRDVH
jgi:ubiquinol-cytochrome c reductase cytochrome c1 subunit